MVARGGSGSLEVSCSHADQRRVHQYGARSSSSLEPDALEDLSSEMGWLIALGFSRRMEMGGVGGRYVC